MLILKYTFKYNVFILLRLFQYLLFTILLLSITLS